ncbi:MAG: hypothetical protein A2000_12410 [Ignavibacteria bacterium GWB2_36_8]|nr:MAG: hypothetical protein A2000_12410 [Ignavibacteria bacterium GWB2_36_8]OGU48561.1 MAG: hypothetical protein A2080_06865 [Ignavibacteria bacterium GWC2_36_12]OGV03532.1 MAG: hypothetical protein A2330_06675 [Ignavibacteria bacterium RIFOXYB2_FULL_36_7]
MKSLITIVITILFFSITAPAQDKTTEEKVTVNKETGDTTRTSSVAISVTEDITPRNDLIVINPLKFLLFYNISYFHKVSENVIVGGGFQAPTISGITGIGFNAEVRFYPKGNNMRGFYVAPNFSYNHLSADEVSSDPVSLGVLIGWQWFPGDQFAIGLGIGVDHYFGSINDANDDFGRYDGFAPALRFDIGFGW